MHRLGRELSSGGRIEAKEKGIVEEVGSKS